MALQTLVAPRKASIKTLPTTGSSYRQSATAEQRAYTDAVVEAAAVVQGSIALFDRDQVRRQIAETILRSLR